MVDIRATRLLVRGERGEIVDTTVRYLQDQETPVEFTLKRMDAGVDAFSTMDTHEGICARQPHVSPCALWTGLNPAVPAFALADSATATACAHPVRLLLTRTLPAWQTTRG